MDDQTNVTQGGITIGEGASITLGAGDVVARDKIVNNIQHIQQRALTAAEQAKHAEAFERQKLAQGVSAHVGRVQAIASDESDSDQPYQGLREYRLSHTENFFGRERAIGELWQALADGPLTVLYGEPGVGKTSFLLSGFASRLIAAGHFSLYLRAETTDPALQLKRGFISDLDEMPQLAAAPLREFLRQVTEVIGADTTLCIFIDAFDAFWAAGNEASGAKFTDQLADCLEDSSLNVRWVLVVRSERFESLSGLRPRIRNPFANTYELRRPSRSEAQAIITAPLARLGLKIEEGLTETLLDQLSKTGLALPQIQIVCEALFKELTPDEKIITRAHYDKLGGVDGLLRRHFVTTLTQQLPQSQRRDARRLVDQLGSTGLRRDQLETPDEVLAQLVNTHLVRVRMTEAGPLYESTLSPLAVEPESDRPLGSLETLRVLGKVAPRVQPQQTDAAAPSVEVTLTQTVEYHESSVPVVEGEIRLGAGASITVGAGDVVGRDKIINNIQNIYQRALTAAEEAELGRSFELQKLAQGVGAFVGRLQTIASDESDTRDANPYKGLLEYRLSDSEIFFGRSQAIRELLICVRRGALTVLQSESGSGKTSLLQAGLSPHLIAGGHLPLYLRPYNADPALVIKRAFIADPSLAPTLAKAPLRNFLFKVCEVLGPETTLYILLDQFEEVFTQQDEAERAEFVRELAECLNDEALNVRWVLALRTEHFGNLANFRPTIRNPYENDYRLNRLTRAEAQEVIVTPAARREVQFESGLVEAILDDLGKTEIAPPQMQLVCASLFNDLKGGSLITYTAYEGEGRAAGILRGHLERVLSRDLPQGSRTAARRLLESLISSEQQRVIRQHQDLVKEMGTGGVTAATLDTILSQLVDSHLIRAAETENGLVYELAHDYLLGEIKLDPAVQARKAAQEMLEQELRAYRRYKTLLTAERLAVIEPYRAELQLTPEAEELLRLSKAEVDREAAEREAARQRELEEAHKLAESERKRAEEQEQANRRMQVRNRIITIVGMLALVAAVLAGILGVVSNQNAAEAQRQARLSKARELAAAALSNLSSDPERSILLAMQAVDVTYAQDGTTLPEVLEALHQSLAISRIERVLASDQYYTSVAFSPVDDKLAAEDASGTVTIWDSASGQTLSTLSAGAPSADGLTRVVFSSDGTKLAATGSDHTARVWEAATGRELLTLSDHTDDVVGLAFSRDGQRIATASWDGTLKVWEAATGRELLTIEHSAALNAVAFSPDDSQLAAGDENGTFIIWNAANGQQIVSGAHVAPPNGRATIVDLAYSPDGTRLATASQDLTAKVWDVVSGRELFTLAGHTDWLTNVLFSPDGTHLATASVDGTAIVWDAKTGQAAFTLSGPTDEIIGLSFSQDGQHLATGGYAIRLWTVGTTHELLTLSGQLGQVRRIAFSPDGARLASAGADGMARVWDANTGQVLSTLVGHGGAVLDVAFSPDGKRLFTGGLDGTARMWDLASGQMLFELAGHAGGIRGVAFSPDGTKVVTASSDQTAKVWDAETGREMLTLTGHEFGLNGVAFSPDGSKIATTNDDTTVKVWDAATGKELWTLESPPVEGFNNWTIGVAFLSQDGSKLVATSANKTAIEWDLNNGTPLFNLSGHAAALAGVAVSPDGALIATASRDRTVKVWEASTGRELFTLHGHTDGVRGVAFSLDGTRLASSSDDGTIRIYVLPLEELMSLARSRLTRTWTVDECQKYLQLDICPPTP
ncbi:MAG: PQQ-binding-like beta-propeller repeat protein [Chloroflexi bacterium]|nr:PQQ-binding-like beta-propeller repeat protein [Chloroflexota bacterium]